MAHPRGATSGWKYGDTTRVNVPLSAYRIDEGAAIYKGQVVQPDGTVRPIGYTADNPLRNRYDSVARSAYPAQASANDDYGYGALHSDVLWRNAIAEVANELSVPGKWVADVMALLTEGHFTSMGSTSPLSLIKADVPITDLRTPKGQTDLLKWASSRHRSDIPKRGPEYLLASVMLQPEQMDEIMADVNKAKTIGNGIRSLREYWDLLGSHSGGMYDHALNAERKAKWSNVHDTRRPSCGVCSAIEHSGTPIFPHEYQEGIALTGLT